MAEQWLCGEVVNREDTPQINSQLDFEDTLRGRKDLGFLPGSEKLMGDDSESLAPPPLQHCLAEIVQIEEDRAESSDGSARTVRTRCALGHWTFGAAEAVLTIPMRSEEDLREKQLEAVG